MRAGIVAAIRGGDGVRAGRLIRDSGGGGAIRPKVGDRRSAVGHADGSRAIAAAVATDVCFVRQLHVQRTAGVGRYDERGDVIVATIVFGEHRFVDAIVVKIHVRLKIYFEEIIAGVQAGEQVKTGIFFIGAAGV